MKEHFQRLASGRIAWIGIAFLSWWDLQSLKCVTPLGEVKRYDYESFHTFSFLCMLLCEEIRAHDLLRKNMEGER